jgi:hypothetical protein
VSRCLTQDTSLGDHNRLPPEPGLARREASYAKNQSKGTGRQRPTTQVDHYHGCKEGAHGEARGSVTHNPKPTERRKADSAVRFVEM